MKNAFTLISGIIVGMIVGYFCATLLPHHDPQTTTQILTETIVEQQPRQIDTIIKVREITARLPTVDTITIHHTDTLVIADSVDVLIPITQKTYRGDNYQAYISGYHPALDSIYIYKDIVTVTEQIPAKPQRWALGITAGYGITPKGTVPYIGLGITYRLIGF